MRRACLLVLTLGRCLYAGDVYAGPRVLGPFVVDDYNLPLQRLLNELGQPASLKANTVCYGSTDGKTYVWIDRMGHSPDKAGTVFLSGFRNCFGQPLKTTPIDPMRWRTEKGIGIGSASEELAKAYGKPRAIEKIVGGLGPLIIGAGGPTGGRTQYGQSIWSYPGGDDDARGAQFGIREGKIVWIFVTHNE